MGQGGGVGGGKGPWRGGAGGGYPKSEGYLYLTNNKNKG